MPLVQSITSLTASGNVTGAFIKGDGSQLSAVPPILSITSLTATGSVSATGTVSASTLSATTLTTTVATVSGNLTAGNVSVLGSLQVAASSTVTGALTAASSLTISGGNLNVSGTNSMLYFNNRVRNNLIVLYGTLSALSTGTETDFFGFGINGGTLRYQVPTSEAHRFYAGTTEKVSITAGSVYITGNATVSDTLTTTNATVSGSLNAGLITGVLRGPLLNHIYGLDGPGVYVRATTYQNLGLPFVYNALYSAHVANAAVRRCFQVLRGGDPTAANTTGATITSFIDSDGYGYFGNVAIASTCSAGNTSVSGIQQFTAVNPRTTHEYWGMTVSADTPNTMLRYQVPTASGTLNRHNFYCGTSLMMTVSTTGVYSSAEVTAYSDARLKANVVPIPDPLTKLSNIGGYTFDRTDIGTRQAGVIAQEIQRVLPEAVREFDGNLTVSYAAVTALCVESIKSLTQRIDELVLSMADLKRKIYNV